MTSNASRMLAVAMSAYGRISTDISGAYEDDGIKLTARNFVMTLTKQ